MDWRFMIFYKWWDCPVCKSLTKDAFSWLRLDTSSFRFRFTCFTFHLYPFSIYFFLSSFSFFFLSFFLSFFLYFELKQRHLFAHFTQSLLEGTARAWLAGVAFYSFFLSYFLSFLLSSFFSLFLLSFFITLSHHISVLNSRIRKGNGE